MHSLQSRFASDVSHELRTPLATIRMAADYIHDARTRLPQDGQRAVVLLERELERFETLLENLLEIGYFDAGMVKPELVEVDLAALLEEVIDSVEAMALANRVHLTLSLGSAERLPIVAGDPRRLFRVFLNLLRNAIEHTTDASVRTKVKTHKDGVVVIIGTVRVALQQDLPHIFERFYRADVHRARTLGGTGLGLAIVLEDVNVHLGDISVDSELGVGSTFTVSLPTLSAVHKLSTPS